MRPGPIEYLSLRSAKDPLLVVEATEDVGWDEHAIVRLASGEVRHGVVLEVDGGLAVVQVFEGTAGIGLDSTSVAFTGEPLQVPVGEEWMGRVANGRGDPIDGGPPMLGGERRSITGYPINPASRSTPEDPITTGVSAVDGLATLVRGQKLPIFSVGGLPHLQLAVQIASQAHAGDEPFRVVFAAMGITNADAMAVRDGLENRARAGELALLLNTAADPVIERVITPRIALTVAEHLAFEAGYHVLVVMVDMTNYAEAVREVASARGEIPTRRGFPGYLYSDLASLYERCGRIEGRPGSVTQLPVLTMPAGDISHPVPDLTGYITEGQLVLSPDVTSRNIYPPFDALRSLSRLMRRGAGPNRTRDDHLDVAAQLLAALDQARQVQEMSQLLGQEALSETDRLYLQYANTFEQRFLAQEPDEERSFEQTLDLGWEALSILPRRELTMVSPDEIDLHYRTEDNA